MANEPDPATNPWLAALDVEVPPLEALALQKGITLRDLMIAALLHAGRPLDLGELAETLEAAGVRAKSGDLALSIPRAWRGREPVWRDDGGKFGIDVHSRELEFFPFRIGVPTGPRLPRPLPPLPPELGPGDVSLNGQAFDGARQGTRITGGHECNRGSG